MMINGYRPQTYKCPMNKGIQLDVTYKSFMYWTCVNTVKVQQDLEFMYFWQEGQQHQLSSWLIDVFSEGSWGVKLSCSQVSKVIFSLE